jgi:hypothetical protein
MNDIFEFFILRVWQTLKTDLLPEEVNTQPLSSDFLQHIEQW